jgi:hypothetical protein
LASKYTQQYRLSQDLKETLDWNIKFQTLKMTIAKHKNKETQQAMLKYWNCQEQMKLAMEQKRALVGHILSRIPLNYSKDKR